MRVKTSPGEILLEEFMKPLGLSGNALARELKVPANRINDIVRGRRDLSADTALRLGALFRHDAAFLAERAGRSRPVQDRGRDRPGHRSRGAPTRRVATGANP